MNDEANSHYFVIIEQNYSLWKTQFETFLAGQGLLGFVNGSVRAPLPTVSVPGINGTTTERPNPEFQQEQQNWLRTNSVVKSWLLGSFAEDILSVVQHCSTSYEVWHTLANHFNRVSSSRLFELERKLQTFQKKDKSMSVYLRELKSVCDQLAAVGSPVQEQMKIFAAMNGLGREYEPIKTTIENALDSAPSPTLDDVIPKLTGYDERLQAYLAENTISPHLAFAPT
ncbi:PREDICTED: uncharacterized protein LOC104705706 isoform X2 [Camelina sativa]|uniref:Uncharacterized protein LOC104705706 isoform X2 n=1 Tax=Camelina sativa TaxID=90675 RepID=A0ABM1QD41_CAMSA|nr:PREDICTED: uncharacterized protein LOC104705706 isoform X2 [Camelina sativa]